MHCEENSSIRPYAFCHVSQESASLAAKPAASRPKKASTVASTATSGTPNLDPQGIRQGPLSGNGAALRALPEQDAERWREIMRYRSSSAHGQVLCMLS